MKLNEHFRLEEFVPRSIYQQYGKNSLWYIDQNIIQFANDLRIHFGKSVYINNWLWGGPSQYRGYRQPWCKVGASKSQHKMGNALDFNIEGLDSNEVREEIIKSWYLFSGCITTIEDGQYTPTWVHVDRRFTGLSTPLIIKP